MDWAGLAAGGLGALGAFGGSRASAKASRYATDVAVNTAINANNLAGLVTDATRHRMSPVSDMGRRALTDLRGTWAYSDPGSYDVSPLFYDGPGRRDWESSPLYRGPYDVSYSASEYNPQNFDFKADPGYEYRLGEGLDAILAHQNAMGLASSGSTGMDFMRHAQGMASDEYSRAWGRHIDSVDRHGIRDRAEDRLTADLFLANEQNNRAEHDLASRSYLGWAGLQDSYADNLAGLARMGLDADFAIMDTERAQLNTALGQGTELSRVARGAAQDRADSTNNLWNNLSGLAGLYAGGYFGELPGVSADAPWLREAA